MSGARPATDLAVDLSEHRHVHVVNVGGAGMSAIAIVLAGMGHRVSGDDPVETPFLDRVRDAGVSVHVGADPALDEAVEVVVTSTATPADAVAVREAHRRGIRVAHRGDALAAICAQRRTVGIAGTHGKTTTASMLAWTLDHAGHDASFLVGAVVTGLATNAAWHDGDWFVAEADESDGTFLALGAQVAVVTNVEPDHLEHWGGFDQLIDAFERYLAAATDLRLVCLDDPVAAEVGRRVEARTFGTTDGADYRIEALETERLGSTFTMRTPDGEGIPVVLPVPGIHNARNAAATFAVAEHLGVPRQAIADGLGAYRGVARRFEHRGEAAEVTFVDSYDHLPTEVRSALAAARQGEWPRVVCVFQPHRYSRTEAMWPEFGDAFDEADVLVLTDVYGAGEPARPGVTGKLLVDAVLGHRPEARVAWMPSLADVEAFLLAELRPGDLCLTLGAGDLTGVPDRVIDALGSRRG